MHPPEYFFDEVNFQLFKKTNSLKSPTQIGIVKFYFIFESSLN